MNIRDIINELLRDNEELYSYICVVKEVNKERRVCRVEPVDGSAEIFNTRLQSKVSGDIGLVLFPVVGSYVTVTFLSKDLAFVSQTSDIEEVMLKIGDSELFIDSENFKNSTENTEFSGKNAKFNLSDLFEVKSARDLRLQALSVAIQATNIGLTGATAIQGALSVSGAVSFGGGSNGGVPKSSQIAQDINSIKDEVNKIRVAFNTWTPVPNDGGAALKAAVGGLLDNLPQTQTNDISNDNVLH